MCTLSTRRYVYMKIYVLVDCSVGWLAAESPLLLCLSVSYPPTEGGTDDKPTLMSWDPDVAQNQVYPITTYQPTYFVAESLMDAKERMREYCENLKRPFYARYSPLTQSIWVDRALSVSDAWLGDEKQGRAK